MSSEEPNYYKWDEFEDIPEEAGIYAWYLPLFLPGTAKNDAADFKKQIGAYADILKRPKATLRMKGNLSAKLTGEIKQIPYGGESYRYSKLLEDNIEGENSRNELYNILNGISYSSGPDSPLAAFPGGLLSPLYIGVAKDLYKRIKSHRKGIQESIEKFRKDQIDAEFYADITEKDEDEETSDEIRDKIFAHRIARGLCDNESRFSPKHLIVYVLPIKSTKIGDAELRKAIEAAETLLNRIHYPAFGRR